MTKNLMLYEIINMSDKYTLRAEDSKVAMMATLVLGEGHYGLTDENGKNYNTLLFLLSKEQIDKVLADNFGDFGKYLDENRAAIADCLDSVMSVGFSERFTYEEAIKRMPEAERKDFRDKVHDKNRSSMNDIGARAWKIAERIRDGTVKGT